MISQTKKHQSKKTLNAIQINSETTHIDLQAILGGQQCHVDCLIVLNCKKQKQVLNRFIKTVDNVILADGGANSFYESECKDSQKLRSIVGDLDSIKPEVKDYYESNKIQICMIQNQDLNDFQKSIEQAKGKGYKNCICVGALGGRMDHTLSALHIATKSCTQNKDMNLILIGDRNIMIYLQPKRKYCFKMSKQIENKCCGLITFSKAQNIETTGFKWNLGQSHGLTSLEWGKFISTSNQIVQSQFTVTSSHELFFVCYLKGEKFIS